jgi:transposase
MAISNDIVFGSYLKEGSLTNKDVAEFIESLDFHDKKYVLLDNASIHKTSLVSQAVASKEASIIWLSPYSPQYQPIEHAFSVIKGYYRQMVPEEGNLKDRVKKCISKLSCDILSNMFDVCWKRMTYETYE